MSTRPNHPIPPRQRPVRVLHHRVPVPPPLRSTPGGRRSRSNQALAAALRGRGAGRRRGGFAVGAGRGGGRNGVFLRLPADRLVGPDGVAN